MTIVGSRKKRWWKVLAAASLVIVVVILAMPVWFPWVLRPALARLGVRFDSYERVGFTRFALTNVRGDAQRARFNGKRIVGFLPSRWLWRCYSRDLDDEPFLAIAHWNVSIESAPTLRHKGPSNSLDSSFAVAEAIRGALPTWRTWLPAAQLTDGSVQFGSNAVTVAVAHWNRGR